MSKYNLDEKKKVKRWWDDDGDNIGYEPGEVSGKFKRKKKVKEEYSNWRDELTEVVELLEKQRNDKKLSEKKTVNNSIKINPSISESVENLGGTLLEMIEIDELDYIVESVYEELLNEGYYENDIENALEYALTEAQVTYGHDTPNNTPEKKKKSLLTKAKEKLSSIKASIKKQIGKGAESIANKAGYVAHRMSREIPHPVHSKTGTRVPKESPSMKEGGKRIEVAGRPKPKTTEPEIKKVSVTDVTPARTRRSSSSTTTPDPWEGSYTTPKKPGSKEKPSAPTGRTRRTRVTTPTPAPSSSKKTSRKAPKKPKPKPKPEIITSPEVDKGIDAFLKSMKNENNNILEKAESEQQQKLFGLALSVIRGETPRSKVSPEVLKIVNTMSEKEIRKFARTKHRGIPKKVAEAALDSASPDKSTSAVIKKPNSNRLLQTAAAEKKAELSRIQAMRTFTQRGGDPGILK
jgi:hypothetical protein